MDADEREGVFAEELDPDDPHVIAALDLVRWELSVVFGGALWAADRSANPAVSVARRCWRIKQHPTSCALRLRHAGSHQLLPATGVRTSNVLQGDRRRRPLERTRENAPTTHPPRAPSRCHADWRRCLAAGVDPW